MFNKWLPLFCILIIPIDVHISSGCLRGIFSQTYRPRIVILISISDPTHQFCRCHFPCSIFFFCGIRIFRRRSKIKICCSLTINWILRLKSPNHRKFLRLLLFFQRNFGCKLFFFFSIRFYWHMFPYLYPIGFSVSDIDSPIFRLSGCMSSIVTVISSPTFGS